MCDIILVELRRSSYHLLNAIVAQHKNCTVGVNTTVELKNITTTSDNKGIYWGMIQPTSVLVLLDVVIVLSSIVVLTPNGSFWVVTLLNSVSVIHGPDPKLCIYTDVCNQEVF